MTLSGDVSPSTETQDIQGTTEQFVASVSSTSTSLPLTPDKIISEFFIRNMSVIPGIDLKVSMDGSTTFTTLRPFESLIWSPKGNLTAINIKSSSGVLNCPYEAIFNFEVY